MLASIAAGRTHREVAGPLVVSTNTVKVHANDHCRQLEARSRAQAVSCARELDLI